MKRVCKHCLLDENHPFGIWFDDDGVCSGCNSHQLRESQRLKYQNFDQIDPSTFIRPKSNQFHSRLFDCILLLAVDDEAHYVLSVAMAKGLNPLVCYFNSGYSDRNTFRYISHLQEEYPFDFFCFSFPSNLMRRLMKDELLGNQHIRKFEIFGSIWLAIMLAERYEITEILTGVRQSDEIVGSIDSFSRTSLSWSEFHDRVVGSGLTDFQEYLIKNSGYNFAYNFNNQYIKKWLPRTKWIFLSDYIFWDSVSINRSLNGRYDSCLRAGNYDPWKLLSSGIKSDPADFFRFTNKGLFKIHSYLSRDIRFSRIHRMEALNALEAHKNKTFDLRSLLEYLRIESDSFIRFIKLNEKIKSEKMLKFTAGKGQTSFETFTNFSQEIL